MYIKKVRIKNYKSFLDSKEINLDRNLFGLIGQNNTGKSTILDAIQCIFYPSTKKEVIRGDFHKNTSNSVEFYISFGEVKDEYLEKNLLFEKIKTEKKKLEGKVISNEEKENAIIKYKQNQLDEIKKKLLISDEIINIKIEINTNGKKKFAVLSEAVEENLTEATFKKILPAIKVIPAIRDPKNESTAGSKTYLKELIEMLDDNEKTQIDIGNGPITYNQLNEVLGKETKNRCDRLGKDITQFYNEAIGSDEFKVVIESEVNISKGTGYNTKIIDTTTGVESNILNCGTGYQSMIILSILETYVKNAMDSTEYILLIEEPEVYLHPSLQRKMIDTLLKISQKNQVIFTSHSPITISKLGENQVKLICKENGEAKIEEVKIKRVIDELGIRPDDIFSGAGVILVEGIDDKKLLRCLLEKLDSDIRKKINIIDVGSCKHLKFYANAEVLINQIYNRPILIIRDSDTKEVEERKEELLNEILKLREESITNIKLEEHIKGSIFIVGGYSIEGYFIDSTFLKKIPKLENSKGKKFIECYECQYNKNKNKVINKQMTEKEFAKNYQPKHVLENFLDKSQKERENKRIQFEKKWRSFDKCTTCGKLEEFFEERKLINKYICELASKKNNFMIEMVRALKMEDLEKSKLKELIDRLKIFIEKINIEN